MLTVHLIRHQDEERLLVRGGTTKMIGEFDEYSSVPA